MPDWTYQTLFRPVLFRMPARLGRDAALAAIGRVARLPGGRLLIEFMGHMRPPKPLHRMLGHVAIDSPVGLAPGIDPHLAGLPGVCRFGFGFVEIGPVTVDPNPERTTTRDDATETILLEPAETSPGLAAVARALERVRSPRPATIVRLCRDATSGDDARIMSRLAAHAAAFSIPIPGPGGPGMITAWADRMRHAVATAPGRPVLVVVPANANEEAVAFVEAACDAGAAGVVVGRAEFNDHAEMGSRWRGAAEQWTRRLRGMLKPVGCVIAGAGVHAPGDAERLIDAGADLVAIDSGLVFGGPGLAKRCNELLLHTGTEAGRDGCGTTPGDDAIREKWPWLLMLGLSMLIGGVMALVIASTRVIMPYDEAMSGLTRATIAGVSPRLLPFMTHDRASLAGAMLGVGILFIGLAWFAARRGQHWAERAVIVPASVGFASFFSFLGFGYFDPFHAFVTTILFQILLLAIVGRGSRLQPCGTPDRVNDTSWLRAQWGQLGFIVHGGIVLLAGVVISLIGMTSVFVSEDLEYLGLCAADLTAVPGLVPLVAHDRGTFGGMLVVAGLTMLLASLWGFRRGEAWLWWTLVASGTVGYAVAIAVHHAVGYDNLKHLAPAYAGLAMVWLAAAASHAFLCGCHAPPCR
jgi:dihydroorotate dehydrogenase